MFRDRSSQIIQYVQKVAFRVAFQHEFECDSGSPIHLDANVQNDGGHEVVQSDFAALDRQTVVP
jgi:hypothetical protein